MRESAIKIGVNYALLFNTIGLIPILLSLLYYNYEGILTKIFKIEFITLIIMIITTYLVVLYLGRLTGEYAFKGSFVKVVLSGIGTALLAIFFAAFIGSIFNILFNQNLENHETSLLLLENYLVAPIFFVLFFGSFIAIPLGIVYGLTVKYKVYNMLKSI